MEEIGGGDQSILTRDMGRDFFHPAKATTPIADKDDVFPEYKNTAAITGQQDAAFNPF